jgi:hypothetical protein
VRDLRIDFFRGLALYMVVVDHIGGDPLGKFTYQAVGFSDAAEVFIFISGVACCGLAYSSLLVRRGWGVSMHVVGLRAIRIYFYYALSSAAMILLITAPADIWGNERTPYR